MASPLLDQLQTVLGDQCKLLRADGQLWFTMPYVEGETLRDHLRRDKQLSIDEALRIERIIAGAVTN